MFHGKKIVVVMPAYNAARTLERTYREIPLDLVDDVIVVDDASRDETVEVARQLGLRTLVHAQNRGYGGNQKTCYAEALRHRRRRDRDAAPGLPVHAAPDRGDDRA